MLTRETIVLDKIKAYLASSAFRDLALRAGWTFIYVAIAALLTSTQVQNGDFSGAGLKAAVIAAVLAGAKSLFVGRYGDPTLIRGTLNDLANRAVHTFWQGLVGAAIGLVTSGQPLDGTSLKIAAFAVAANVIKGLLLPGYVPGSDQPQDSVNPALPAHPPAPDVPKVGDPAAVEANTTPVDPGATS